MSGTLLENEIGISFKSNENQQMIAEMIRKFGKEHILPKMMEWDETQEFPVEVFKKLGDLGLMGVLVPAEYGGSGFGYSEYVTAITELASICGSIGLSMAAHNSLCTGHIMQFGNEEQKKKYLPKLATAEWIGRGPLGFERHQELDHTRHLRRRGRGAGAHRGSAGQPWHYRIRSGAHHAGIPGR
jgi:alkylation response protein AidB-like acyl-CoA dehydrogenase